MGKSKGFKKILFISCFFFLFIAGSYGQKALPVYDGINYSAGTLAYDDINWWCLNVVPVNDVTVASGSLVYPGLLESAGNKLSFNGGGDEIAIFFGNQAADTKVFYSFIFQVTDLTGLTAGSATDVAGFSNAPNTSSAWGCSLIIQKDASDPTKFNLGHGTRSSLPVWNLVGGVPVKYPVNTPIFIVSEYDIIGTYVSGTPDDKSSMWINPDASTFENSIPPVATITGDLTGSGINDINPLNRFYLKQDAVTSTPFVDIDEIRTGLTWASVTPKQITTGTKELLNDKTTASVYPNPVNDLLKVDIKNADIKSIEIYNISGIRLITKKVGQGANNIDISGFPQGMYTVIFKGSGVTVNRKFIKK
jgi:hypothetical protein